jgi:hypothetical protein
MSSAADKNAHDETPKTKASAATTENGEQVADALFSPYEHFSGITLKNRYSTDYFSCFVHGSSSSCTLKLPQQKNHHGALCAAMCGVASLRLTATCLSSCW